MADDQGFSTRDVRRVAEAFDEAIPHPYKPAIVLAETGESISVTIKDPGNPALTVAQCRFDYQFLPRRRARSKASIADHQQPSAAEIKLISSELAMACRDYTPPIPGGE